MSEYLKVVVNGKAYYIKQNVMIAEHLSSELRLLQASDFALDLRTDEFIKNRFGCNEYILDKLLNIQA